MKWDSTEMSKTKVDKILLRWQTQEEVHFPQREQNKIKYNDKGFNIYYSTKHR